MKRKSTSPNYPYNSYSWEVYNVTVATKQTDKSVFLHHGTGIPQDIRFFFEVDEADNGDKIPVKLKYRLVEYDADIIIGNNRARLLWKGDLSRVIQSEFPVWHQKFSEDAYIENSTPIIRFHKCPEGNDHIYELELIDLSEISEDIDAEKLEEYEPKKEGMVREYYGKRYERIPANRQKAIEIHGTTCVVCGFNFEQVYGERGKGFIEIHHTRPLHKLNEEYAPDPATELIPVCANCHRMIHRRSDDVLSADSLIQLFTKRMK